METFTIHGMLMNSTDLNKILCNFGIKNISECEDEEDSTVEPKGTQPAVSSSEVHLRWDDEVMNVTAATKINYCTKCDNFVLEGRIDNYRPFYCLSAHYAQG